MYNFSDIVDRTGTDSVKYYLHPESKYEKTIPMFIADMDFETAPAVKKAVMDRASHGIYGYTVNGPDYYAAVKHWLKTRHRVDINTKWITTTPGVVAALKNSISAYTKEGDGILIQEPVYHFFRDSVQCNQRKVVNNKLIFHNGAYQIDFDDFEEKICQEKVKLFFLCNPHNPTGNVWSRDELVRMGNICKKYGVIVIDDEIHNDFVFSHAVHTPFVNADPSFWDFTVFCTAPSKTFNLAGIKTSNVIISNPELKKSFDQTKAAHGLGASSAFSGKALIAAYTQGAAWVDEMLAYVRDNFCYLDTFLTNELSGVHLINRDSLYLAWIDCRAWNLSDDELKAFFIHDCGVIPSMGTEFGVGGDGFVRLNLACPRALLEEALERIKKEACLRKLL